MIAARWSYERMISRAFDKIRQAARGMPAVIIRMLDTISVVANSTISHSQRDVLRRQAAMVMRDAEETVDEPNDLADIQHRFDRTVERLE